MSGFLLSRLKRSRWIFNVSDLWPKSAAFLDVLSESGLAYRISSWLERFCYHRAWLVSGQSESILDDISQRFPRCRTFHFSNGVDTKKFAADIGNKQFSRGLGTNNEFIVTYAGLHGIAQGLDQIIRVASQLQEKKGLRFVLIGDGPEKEQLVKMARKINLSNVTFLDPCPKDEIPPLLAASNLILVPLKKHLPGAVPSKLYEAMASSKPVILVAEGEAADIVNRTRSGIVITPGDINGIKETIVMLKKSPSHCKKLGKNGREAAQNYFDRTTIVDRFIDYLEVHT